MLQGIYEDHSFLDNADTIVVLLQENAKITYNTFLNTNIFFLLAVLRVSAISAPKYYRVLKLLDRATFTHHAFSR